MTSEKKRQYQKEYYLKNKEVWKNKYHLEKRDYRLETMKKYRITHKEEILRKQNENKEVIYEKHKIYRQENLEKIYKQKRLYRQTPQAKKVNNEYASRYKKQKKRLDINFKISVTLRNRISYILKGNAKPSGSAVRDLGCSISELKDYLETKFSDGMNWGNHAKKGWHIDHIIPLSSFDLTIREQFLRACNYTNLQPLWWDENISKGKKIAPVLVL